MMEDRSIRSVDRQKLKGYLLKWQDAKFLLGCAFFHDLLRPLAILCKVLREDELCVVRAVESVFKVKRSMEKTKETSFEELPTVKKVRERVQQDGTSVTYQSAELKRYNESFVFLKSNHPKWVKAVEDCILKRLKAQAPELELLTYAITVLSTHGWECSDDPSFGYTALSNICLWFRDPLDRAGVDRSLVQEEWDDIVEFSKRYLNLVQDEYKVVWWKLFNSFDSKKWSIVLAVVNLLFCLPMANGRVERVFSQLKLIKHNRRTCLKEDTLDHLLRINADGPSLADWNANRALELWWSDKTCRINRKDSSQPTCSAPAGSRAEEEDTSDTEDHLKTGKNGYHKVKSELTCLVYVWFTSVWLPVCLYYVIIGVCLYILRIVNNFIMCWGKFWILSG